MFGKKKENRWTDGAFVILLCFVMDFLMLGICGMRLFHWTRMGYIIALMAQGPWPLAFGAGLSSVAVAGLLNGQYIAEIAVTTLIGIITTFFLQRTLSLSFARSIVASVLLVLFMGASYFLDTGSTWSGLLSGWTFLQIIANIVIINILLKSMS